MRKLRCASVIDRMAEAAAVEAHAHQLGVEVFRLLREAEGRPLVMRLTEERVPDETLGLPTLRHTIRVDEPLLTPEAMLSGNDLAASGGFLVPPSFFDTLIAKMEKDAAEAEERWRKRGPLRRALDWLAGRRRPR